MKQVKIGIIGTGFTIGIANSHFIGYRSCANAEVAAVYDIVPGRAEVFLDQHKIEGVTICASLDELFGMVDAVSICTPNSTHADLAVKALEAGKHVIVEKPFSTTYEEGMKALKCARKHPDLVAMTVFNYREGAQIQFMKRIIDTGALGTIISMRYSGGGGRMWDNEKVYLEWRMKEETSGTGSMADFGVHQLDLVDYLLHDRVGDFVSFTGMSSTIVTDRYEIDPTDPMGGPGAVREKGRVTNDDVSAFAAVSESGTLFNFQTGRLIAGGSTFEIVGSAGMVSQTPRIPGPDQKQTLLVTLKEPEKYVDAIPELKPLTEAKAGPFGMPPAMPIEVPADLRSGEFAGLGHGGVLGEFVDCILTGKQPARSFARGMYVQRLIDNFAKAAKSGQTVYEKVTESAVK